MNRLNGLSVKGLSLKIGRRKGGLLFWSYQQEAEIALSDTWIFKFHFWLFNPMAISFFYFHVLGCKPQSNDIFGLWLGSNYDFHSQQTQPLLSRVRALWESVPKSLPTTRICRKQNCLPLRKAKMSFSPQMIIVLQKHKQQDINLKVKHDENQS